MLKIDCKKETDKIVKFIQDTFEEKGFERAIIGVSGGLDSAVVVALLIKALNRDNVCGYYMPIETPKDFTSDACAVSDKFKIHMDIYSIKKFIEMFKITFPELKTEKIRLGNLMARTRMMILYDMSAKYDALVVGTSNKTELTLGYFTMYGDAACALEPIGHLYKTQVKQIAEHLDVPKQIIEKAPSAELWEGQTDEDELGMTYDEIDKQLVGLEELSKRVKDVKCLTAFPMELLTHNRNILLAEHKKIFDKYNHVLQRIDKNKFKSESPKIIRD